MTECNHPSEFILEDFTNGTLVCMKCGIVLENSIFGRVTQEVELFNVARPKFKYFNDLKNMACMLNLKEDAVELATNLYLEYTTEKQEKKILTIVFLYYASRMLLYSIDIKNFKTTYDNENIANISCHKKFNSYLHNIDTFFKQKYKSFDELNEKFKIPSQFDYYFDLFYSFFKSNKSIYNLNNSIYTQIVNDLICKRQDVMLVCKSQYSLFLVCFLNCEHIKKLNLKKKTKQEICNHFKINLSSLTSIERIHRALSQML